MTNQSINIAVVIKHKNFFANFASKKGLELSKNKNSAFDKVSGDKYYPIVMVSDIRKAKFNSIVVDSKPDNYDRVIDVLDEVVFISKLNGIYYNSDKSDIDIIDTDQFKANINIVDVISARIDLRNLKACCPFHDEKTPSFSVSESKQLFKCFGCGVSGDVIEFVMLYEKCDFKEAITKLGGK